MWDTALNFFSPVLQITSPDHLVNISDCIELSQAEHISGLAEVSKILKCLKVFKAEWIFTFTPQTGRVMSQTNKLNKFAVTQLFG